MTEPIKHHFSPVFYLRGWCDSTASQLIQYSRTYRDVIAGPRSAKATGFEPLLYTMNGVPDDQKQTIEKDYMAAKVDDPGARALRVLLGINTSALTEGLRAAWTRFMLAAETVSTIEQRAFHRIQSGDRRDFVFHGCTVVSTHDAQPHKHDKGAAASLSPNGTTSLPS